MKEDINMDNLTTLMEMRDENCYLEELLELEKYLEVRKFKVMERLNYLRNRISERESINENNT
jgi:exoribonuclease II